VKCTEQILTRRERESYCKEKWLPDVRLLVGVSTCETAKYEPAKKTRYELVCSVESSNLTKQGYLPFCSTVNCKFTRFTEDITFE
jgi:hypothetical protein